MARFDCDPLVGQGARDSTADYFEELKAKAIQNKENFAFETNLNDSRILLPHIEQFRKSGYNIMLEFIFLESVEMAIERVKHRVAEKGHSVPEDEIGRRYSNGLKVLDENFHQFDYVNLYLSIKNGFNLLISFLPKENKIVTEKRYLPQTVRDKLPNLVKFIDGLRL